ncbi:MBL fold metallo-hydrolase [Desertimonas flava]|uniref:MBL fold metallo-hydrolase n=1 Tax=Desertimonas flava TaxID=2064846 RepID=UPI000E341245|nr:MBL fold metallo-hydrolase [Desertimonas flava]
MSDLALTHIGGPTLLIEVAGWRILTDPTFDPPGHRYHFGWGTASTKTTGPAATTADIGPVDAVLLTHDHHADNLDRTGRDVLRQADIVLTTTSGARRLGGSARGLANWETTTLSRAGRPSLGVTATPCRHGPPLSRPIVGDVVGFAITSAAQPDGALWISGDTVLFDGLEEVVERVRVDVAVLHLGGVRFPISGPLRYTMTADDGLELCRRLQPRLAVPVHYEGWSHFKDPATALHTPGGAPDSFDYTVLPIGERTSIGRLGTEPSAGGG